MDIHLIGFLTIEIADISSLKPVLIKQNKASFELTLIKHQMNIFILQNPKFFSEILDVVEEVRISSRTRGLCYAKNEPKEKERSDHV